MSATFQLRKAWGGWSLSGGINVPSRTTAIAANELYFYSIDTSNSVNVSQYPVKRSTSSGYNKSYENYIYLYMTKAPAAYCSNFKFWGSGVDPDAGVFLYIAATAQSTYHTTLQSSAKCTSNSVNYYSPGTAKLVPGRCSQVGSSSGYLIKQVRVSSASVNHIVSNENCVWHYGYDEV